MNFDEKTFKAKLKELILNKGCTQLELAKYVGVKPNTVSDWIRKGTSPKIKHINKIVEYFDVSYDYLFTGMDDFRRKPNIYELDENEQELINNFRNLPSTNVQIRFLGIANDKIKDLNSDYQSEKNAV